MSKKGLLTKPSFRKLRGYAFDPSLSLRVETAGINDIVYKVQWEELEPGPIGEYLEVIDYDPTVEKYYKPVDLQDSYVLAQDGISPSEGNPQFHQQMVYAVAMTTIKNFERALGRKILWATNLSAINTAEDDYVERLRIYPHALREPNAYYSPMKKALLFGYFGATPANEALHMNDALVFTCLSHDIIAHEVTHAILDGMHRNYNDATNPDILAFHEAFADIVALFQHFTFPEVLKHQVAKTRGQLESQNLLGQLAQEFGTAIGSYGSLRDALGEIDADNKWKPKTPNPDDYKILMEPHARGSILVAAVFDAFLTIYKGRVADLLRIASNGSGILPQGELHPDLINRLASEASKAAGHVLNMCIRAIDYCPPVDLTFGDYLRAIITADIDLVPEDSREYRIAFMESFRRRGIYPEGIKTLSEDSLRYTLLNIGLHSEVYPGTIETTNIRIQHDKDTYAHSKRLASQAKITIDESAEDLLVYINEFLREYGDEIKYVSHRKMIYDRTKEYVVGKKNKSGQWEKGLHGKLTMKFSNSSFFTKITGLAFIDSYKHFGIRKSDKYEGPSFQIQNLRLVSRVGPNGNQINQVVFSIVQRSGIVFENGCILQYFEPPDYYGEKNIDTQTIPPGGFEFTGGCTLIFDLDTLKLKYAISKPLLDFNENDSTNSVFINIKRAKEQYQYQNGDDKNGYSEFSMYFGNGINRVAEPFAFLHQH